MNHIPIDLFGLIKLTGQFSKSSRERLQWLVNDYNSTYLQSGKQIDLSLKLNSKIPFHISWTVKELFWRIELFVISIFVPLASFPSEYLSGGIGIVEPSIGSNMEFGKVDRTKKN